MSKMKKIMALMLAAMLMLDPIGVLGGMPKVEAAKNNSIYSQMKLLDVTMGAGGLNKDALEIGDDIVKLELTFKVQVPEGWYVEGIDSYWTGTLDELSFEQIFQEYDKNNQPEDGIYKSEILLHKYKRADSFSFESIDIEFMNLEDENKWFSLSGVVLGEATANNPVDIEWTGYDHNFDDYEFDFTSYDGRLDYKIKSASGKDTKVPLVKKIELKSPSVVRDNTPTEIDVTVEENGSGIESILIFTFSDTGAEILSFEAEVTDIEKYTGKQTFTLKSNEELLKERESESYYISDVYVIDFAGNYMSYYAEEAGEDLVGEEFIQNSNGSVKIVEHTLKNLKYSICYNHSYKKSTTKATTKKDGKICWKCEYCGSVEEGSTETISKIKSVKLSNTSYTYNGKVCKPSVSVYNSKGKKISSDNYTVTYPSGRKYVGEYKVKIQFKGNYSGTEYRTYTIKPKTTSITSSSGAKKNFTVKWKKQSTQTSGYQIKYSTNSKFSSSKTKTISSNKTTSSTIKDLKANTKYYVKIRTYKKVKINGEYEKIYSSWSGVKTVKTK